MKHFEPFHLHDHPSMVSYCTVRHRAAATTPSGFQAISATKELVVPRSIPRTLRGLEAA